MMVAWRSKAAEWGITILQSSFRPIERSAFDIAIHLRASISSINKIWHVLFCDFIVTKSLGLRTDRVHMCCLFSETILKQNTIVWVHHWIIWNKLPDSFCFLFLIWIIRKLLVVCAQNYKMRRIMSISCTFYAWFSFSSITIWWVCLTTHFFIFILSQKP